MLAGVLLRPVFGNVTDYAMGNVVCSICLVLVIFYGGFGTNFKEARPVAGRALLLSFAGTALTAGLVGVGVWCIFQPAFRRHRLGRKHARRLGHQLDGRRLRL